MMKEGYVSSNRVYLVFMLKPNNSCHCQSISTMSRSTTGTSSYILSKYSRSYPTKSKRTVNKAQTQTQVGPETSEWLHFTNPVIRLVLDVKTSSSAEIESVRLRIMWQIENDSNSSAVAFASLFGFVNSFLGLF